ncbi:YTH domain-containing protein [Sarracenia purpurea var. burkii]
MDGEKKFEKPDPAAAVFKSEPRTKLDGQHVASGKDGTPSVLNSSSISSSGDATTSIKGEIGQKSVAEQGVYYPPTSYYDYHYPGSNGTFTQFNDQNHFNAGGGSYTLGSVYQSARLVKGSHPIGKYSSFINPNQSLLMHNSSMSYRPNGRVWNGDNKIKSRDRNVELDASTQLTRGPRYQNGGNHSNLSEEEQLGPTIRRDLYNLEGFQTEYDNAKFFVIKSYSEDDIHKCIKYDVWSSTRTGNKKLDAAFHDAEAKASETGTKCPVFLFFSVNASGQFLGVAEMIGPVDFNKDMDFWQLDKWNGFFPVNWHIIKDVPNSQLCHIILENSDNRDVTYTRDTQEIGLKQGLEMLNIFKNYLLKKSILDDFNFYENREKSLKAKRNSKLPSSQIEMHNNHNFPKHLETGERTIEIAAAAAAAARPTGCSSDHHPTLPSVINLTQNLSLNSHPKESKMRRGANMNPRDNSSSVPLISASKPI